MMHDYRYAAVAAAMFLAGSPVAAQVPLGGMITGNDVDRILEIVSAYGPAERNAGTGEHGPWISAEMDGIYYSVSFLNCTQGQNCTTVQFRATWASNGAHTIAEMARWNRERRFSKAYLDSENDATIEFDVNLAGGVTAVNFDDTVQWWQLVLGEFVADVIEPGYAAQGGGSAGAPPLSK